MAHVGEALIEAVDASAAPWHSSSTTTSSSTGFNEVPFGSDFDGSKGFTRVSFAPDLSALSPSFDGTSKSGGKGAAKQSTRMHTGDLAALRRRAVEMAGCLASQGVKVSLDGHPVPVASFADFARMFMSKEATESAVAEVGGNGRWEVVVCPASALRSVPESDTNTEGKNESSSSSGGHVSFVNGMATPRGGTHITHAVTPLVKALADAIAKRNPELSITPAMVKQATVVYVSAQIENPTFDSQMKECLATRPSAFGSAYVPSKPFVRRILETTSLEEEVVEVARRRSLRDLNKQKVKASGSSGTRQKLLKIPKLDDAYYAGAPSKALDCTLILTEGDSAKALAVAGLEVVGRDTFGVFPLRGKLLNARDATKAQLLNNAELMALCSILNLDFNKTYKDGPDASMRYGSVMIMADQDHDGSHIKGLIINFFHKFWPALLQHDGFLQQFATPVLKATPIKKGASKSGQNKKASPNETLSFYSTSDYDRWRKTLADKVASAVVASRQSVGPSTKSELDKWRVKYYKGLGTSTAAEAKAYFADLKQHQSNFVWQSSGSGDSQDDAPDDDADNLIDLVFNKSRAADRRAWLLEHCAPEPLPPQQPTVSYTDFVNRELVHFSHADNVRSIPSVLDGLKPSQRKLLYACFKRKLTDEVKVAQLSGCVH
jgi:DNA topoisomerase-2